MRPNVMEEVEALRGVNSVNIKEAHETGKMVKKLYLLHFYLLDMAEYLFHL